MQGWCVFFCIFIAKYYTYGQKLGPGEGLNRPPGAEDVKRTGGG